MGDRCIDLDWASDACGPNAAVEAELRASNARNSPKADIDEIVWGLRSTVGYPMMRLTMGVIFVAALTISGAAQDLTGQSGAPAAVFQKPDRPVADIVSPIWHDEKERDDRVNLLVGFRHDHDQQAA